jgi:hypothetical protein
MRRKLLLWMSCSGIVGIALPILSATQALARGGDDYCLRVPELDPGLLAMGVALLAGSFLLFRERRRLQR